MGKNEANGSRFAKNLKKIPGFIADVAKYTAGYIARKTKELAAKKLNGRTWGQMLRDDVLRFLKWVKGLSVKGKALFAAVIVLIVCVCSVHGYVSSHFLAGTVIEGIDVSGMSLHEARKALEESCAAYKLDLIEKNGRSEQITGSEIGLSVTIDDKFDDILKLRSGYFWLRAITKNETVRTGDTIRYSYNESLLDSKISQLECVTASSSLQPSDAELYFDNGEFVIRPAVSGGNVDKEKLESRVKAAINAQEASLDLEAEKIYEQPDVLSDDPSLASKKTVFDELKDIHIVLKFGDSVESITPETISGWYTSSGGDVKLDDTLIKSYVETIAAKYNNIDSPKKFITHGGETVEIDNSYYGWQLDNDYAAEMLRSYVVEKKSVTLDLTNRSEESDKWWYKHGVDYSALGYYGNTYAEVSIDGQYMWMYKDGKVAFESEVVTGLPDDEHDTPVGIYSILYMEENATLRGDDYETVVAYWMVFTDDIGFHDADWQDAFGDDMYESNGSHGCVNLPVEAAGELYQLVYIGMPVFVY